MNDEIREILKGLKKYANDGGEHKLMEYEIKHIQCYITNLQQENEELMKNQRFHKKFGNDYIFCVEGDKETYKDLLLEKQEELEDYKSRVEKVVEYFKYQLEKLNFYEDTKARMLCAMGIILLQNESDDNE